MTQDSVRLIQRYFEAFNAHQSEGMLACLEERVVHDVNQGARRIGRAVFAEFLTHMDRCYDEKLRDIVIMVSADGTRAAAEYVVHGRYQSDDEGLPPARGQAYVLPAGSFFEISGGKITRVTTYYNLKNWIEQVEG